uniref:Uncharacterized protein n=1 Tax=Phlebotomus papatasi TaxID=29031 RepID=A0A1B0D7P7_PHLPP
MSKNWRGYGGNCSSLKQELAKAQRSWMDRLNEAESIRKSEMEMLKRKGLTLNTDRSRKEPCLVNLDPDHILSGTLVYPLPLGLVKIGRHHPTSKDQPDIILEGPLVAFNHCSIENTHGILFLTPSSLEFETFVNGQLIVEQIELHHGDRVVIGGSHYFRVSNPSEGISAGVSFDFHQAHQEIQETQERRLREEVNAVKRSAEKEMQEELDTLQREVERLKSRKEFVEAELEILKVYTEMPEEEVIPSRYKSNLLDDLQNIMTRPSEDSLHKIQLHVKEATQRCRDIGLMDYEFRQSQVCDELGLFRAVVNIVDRGKRQVAEWPPARLEVWLNMMREAEMEPAKVFDCMEMDWKPLDETNENALNESINSGKRISLNLSGRMGNRTPPSRKTANVKPALRAFHSSVQKKLFAESPNENISPLSERLQTPGDFVSAARPFLRDLNVATNCLRNLCHDDRVSSRSRQFLTLIDHMDNIVGQMTQLLREEDSNAKTPKTPKSVRFLLD